MRVTYDKALDSIASSRKLRIAIGVLVALSGMVYAFTHTLDIMDRWKGRKKLVTPFDAYFPSDQLTYQVLSPLGGLVFFAVFYALTIRRVQAFAAEHRYLSAASIFFALTTVGSYYFSRPLYYLLDVQREYWHFPIVIAGALALAYLILAALTYLVPILCDLWGKLDERDRKFYIWATVISFAALCIIYAVHPILYRGYNSLWQTDSRYVLKVYLMQPMSYDIRHPLQTLPYYIFGSTAKILSLVFRWGAFESLFTAIMWQFVCVQALLVCAGVLRVLSRSPWLPLLYMASFSTLWYAMVLEKYQIPVALTLLYVYQLVQRKDGSGFAAMSILLMPYNLFLWIGEFLVKKPLKAIISQTVAIGMLIVGLLIGTGRVAVMWLGPFQVAAKKSSNLVDPGREIFSVLNMIVSCFVPLDSHKVVGYKGAPAFEWRNVGSFVPLSVLIAAVMILGLVVAFKQPLVRISALWILVSAFMFIVVHWANGESPLFNIYFGWAAIVLVFYGLQYLTQRLKLSPKAVFGSLCAVLVATNLSALLYVLRMFS